MNRHSLRLALLAILFGTAAVQADVLVMKNGTRVEGNILQESPESIRMRYRLTPKIWDEKTFQVADIAQIIKQTPQEVELIELRKLLPTSDLLSADKYEQIIQDRLRPFVNKYKGTKEAQEAEGIIAQLQEEKAKVAGGQLKFEGRWLPLEEAKAEQFNVQASKFLKNIQEKLTASDWPGTLREYDLFLRETPALRATRYYIPILESAQSALDKWASILDKMATEQPILKRDREAGLKKLQEPELSRTKAAIANELAIWKAEAQAARNNRVRWIEPNKYDLPSIQSVQKEVLSERARLGTFNIELMKQNIEPFNAVLREIGEKDYTGGLSAYQQVAHLAANPQFKDIIQDFNRRLLIIYNELYRQTRPGASAMTSGSTAIGGTAVTGQDERVARILAESASKAGVTSPAATQTPAAATPAAGATGTQAVPGAVRPQQPAVQQPATGVRPSTAVAPAASQVAPRPVMAATQTVAAAPAPAVVAETREVNVQMYLLIGAGVLVAVLLAVYMTQKKKSEEEA